MWWLAGGPAELKPNAGVHLYRLTYATRNTAGALTLASGLLAVPARDGPAQALVSWQHGTASLRNDAPSQLSRFHGLLPAAAFAGQGYVLAAPDYIGLGASTEHHSYYHTASIANAVVDYVTAVRATLRDNRVEWNDALYLTGFSQGGHASLAAQRLMEQERRHTDVLRGTAPIAAAVDLAGIAWENTLRGRSKFASLYLAWIGASYVRDYALDPLSILSADWLPVVRTLFDGSHDGATIIETLPANPGELVADDLFAAAANNRHHAFIERLHENSLLDWVPRTPVCGYYGNLDVDVTPAQAARMATLGDAVSVRSVGDVDHEESILIAAPLVLDWFHRDAPAGAC